MVEKQIERAFEQALNLRDSGKLEEALQIFKGFRTRWRSASRQTGILGCNALETGTIG